MLDFDHDDQLKTHEVRLLPPVRISSEREAELRATAALLAVVKGVSPFDRAIVKLAGGPAGKLSCYTEVSLPPLEPDGPRPRPDGILRSVRGKQEWKALVEVKVGDSPREQQQFDTYQRVASEQGFDALTTISSQAARADALPPSTLAFTHNARRPIYVAMQPLGNLAGPSPSPLLSSPLRATGVEAHPRAVC